VPWFEGVEARPAGARRAPQKGALRVTFVTEPLMKAVFGPFVLSLALLLKRYRLCYWLGSLMREVPLKSTVKLGPRGLT
jgi:hypothetical protein